MNGVSESVACTTFFMNLTGTKIKTLQAIYTFYNKMVHDDSFLFRK